MKKTTATTLLSCLLLSLSPLSFAESHHDHDHHDHEHHAHEEHRQHGAHEHGKIEFHLAQEGDELLMELHAPGYDLMGFESQPKTDEQKAAFARAKMLLNQPEKLFSIDKSAKCVLEKKEVTSSLDEHKHDHDAHKEGSHSEFHAEYHFECSALAKLHHIDYHWFKLFPATQSISVSSLTDAGAKTTVLTPKSTEFHF